MCPKKICTHSAYRSRPLGAPVLKDTNTADADVVDTVTDESNIT